MSFTVMSVTAFSPVYEVTVGGNRFGGEDIVSMRLIRSCEDPPVKGIVSSEFIIALRTDIAFEQNAPVKVIVSGKRSMSFCDHFISRVSRKGGIVTIHAMDRMRKTDIPFDDSLYNEEDQLFDPVLVIPDLGEQCGFSRAVMPSGFGMLRWEDIHDKRCREILNLISERLCGAWYCSDNDELCFIPFLSFSTEHTVNGTGSSSLYFHSVKGPFRGILGKNTASGEVFGCGDVSSFGNVLRVSGKLIDSASVQSVMSGIAEKKLTAFYCDHMVIDGTPCGISSFCFDEVEDRLLSFRTAIVFGGGDVFVMARAEDICEDEAELMTLRDYELRARIEEGRAYGSTVMTPKGLGIVDDSEYDDVRDRKAYFFSKAKEGITEFEGAVLDKTLPKDIIKVSDTARRIVYEGAAYLLSWTVDPAGQKHDFTLEKCEL